MDGLSGAASGMAVVSLALQLGGSIKQLYDFWDSVNDAPDEIRGITTDLSLLASVLTEMAFEEQHSGPDHTLNKVLEACCDRVNKLTRITSDIEPGFASRSLRVRKWTAFKAVFKGEKIQKFQTTLEGLKSTLMLAQQSHHSRLDRIRYETQQRNLATITKHVSGLDLEHFSATITTVANSLSAVDGQTSGLRAEASRICRNIQDPVRRVSSELGSDIAVQSLASNLSDDRSTVSWPVANPEIDRSALLHRDTTMHRSRQQTLTKSTLSTGYLVTSIFGAIITNTTTRLLRSSFADGDTLDDDGHQSEHESTFRILPAQWLLKLGFKYAYSFSTHDSATQGWQWCIKPIHLVPDDASIFEFCWEGNLEKVRDLFSRNLASVRDVNSDGFTALHYAVGSHNPELCRFLIEAGADKNARSFGFDFGSRSPLTMICWGEFAAERSVKAIDTCRIFEDSFDFWDETGGGWDILGSANNLYRTTRFTREVEAELAFYSMFIKFAMPDIKANYSMKNMVEMIFLSDDRRTDAVELLLRLSTPGALIDLDQSSPSSLSLLSYKIIDGNWKIVNLLLAWGADPHHVGLSAGYSPIAESPLSLAMYSSWAFWGFRNILHGKGLDLEDFARQELKERHPLLDAGWRIETLTALLELDFEPGIQPSKDVWGYYQCDCCRVRYIGGGIQMYWQGVLECIKDGSYPQRSCADRQDEQLPVGQSHLATSDKDSLISTTEGCESSDDSALLQAEAEAAQSDEESSKSGSDTRSTIFDRKEVWCIWCWYHFKKTGHRPSPGSPELQSLDGDDSSEDDFSPYLFNT